MTISPSIDPRCRSSGCLCTHTQRKMESLLVSASLFLLLFLAATRATVTLSPSSRNIAEGDTAVYNCSSNHSSVVISWYFNGTIPALSLTSNYGVTAIGAGSSFSSLSVPGLVYPFNNTNVSCYASGPGIGDVSPPPVILRVQGPPGAVVDISVNFSSCAYYISWTAPFTLSGFPILQYNIHVTNINSTVVIHNITATEWSYSPKQFGNYSVSVAAVNSVGEGESAINYFYMDEYTIKSVTCANRYKDSNEYLIIVLHIEVSVVTDWLKCIISVVLVRLDNATDVAIASSSNITVNNQLLIATLNTSSLDDKYHTFTIHLLHTNGLQVNYNKPLRLSFFDVSNFSIVSIESNTVTFMCDFVRGSQAIGCHISLNDSLLNTSYSINITREIRTGSLSVPAGNYSISVFDINEYNSIPTLAAITSTVVIVTATSTSSPTSMLSLSGSTSSPSPSQTVNVNNTATDINASTVDIIVGAIVGSVIAVMLLVIVPVILVASCYIMIHKSNVNAIAVIRKGTSEDKKVSPSQHDVHLVQLNYIDVEHDPNAPMAPPPFDPNPAPYSDVITPKPYQREQNVHEALHDQQLVTGSSHQLYSTLDHNNSKPNVTAIHTDTALYSKLNCCSQDSATTPSTTVISDNCLPDSEPEYITQTKLTHSALSEHVAPRLINKWREVGLALTLTPPQLNDIEENHQGISDVFQMWEDLKTRPFNWETLLTILRSSGVNECELADRLERQFVSCL